MKKILYGIGLSIVTIFASGYIYGQCPTITCPGNVTVSNDVGTCGAIINYVTPVGTDLCAAPGSGNILVVSDAAGATEIAPALTAAGYTVTSVSNDFVGGNNTVLQGVGLSTYSAIYWHAVGTGLGTAHNPATFTNLSTYISGGGTIFVHGYDVIASPTDPNLIAFLGGTSSVDVPGGGGLGTIAGPTNSLNNGVTNIIGLTLANGGDHDALVTLTTGTIGVAPNASGWDWSIRTLGSGEIAYVSTGQNTGTFPNWTTPGSGYAEALLNFAFNNSGGPTTTMIAGLASGAIFPLGITTVTYEVVDNAGLNPMQCSFTVTVADTQAPFAACPSNRLVNNDAGICSAVVTYSTPVAVDNCSGGTTTLTSGLASGSTFPIGVSTVTYTAATDSAGNVGTSCSFTVTVVDTEIPVLTCPDSLITCDSIVMGIAPTTSDNCAGEFVIYTLSGATIGTGITDASGETFNIGITNVMYQVTDLAGNTDSCSFYVQVDNCVGIDENNTLNNLKIYPNPNNGVFTLNTNIINATIKVMNVHGQIVLTKNIIAKNTKIDLSNNVKGIYFLTVTSKEGVFNQKVIVQ